MIYLLLPVDILINNYTPYTSFFFLMYLYNKKYSYYLITALILDLVIFKSFYNIIILTIIYFINKIFKDLNKNNIISYLFIMLFNYILYIFLSNIIMSNSIFNILIKIEKNILFNLILYTLSFNIARKEKIWIK